MSEYYLSSNKKICYGSETQIFFTNLNFFLPAFGVPLPLFDCLTRSHSPTKQGYLLGAVRSLVHFSGVCFRLSEIDCSGRDRGRASTEIGWRRRW